MKTTLFEKFILWGPQIGAVALMLYIAYKEFN